MIFIEDITEKLINVLKNNEKIAIVGPKLLNKDLTLQKSYYDFEHGFKLIKSQLNIFSKVFSINRSINSKKVDYKNNKYGTTTELCNHYNQLFFNKNQIRKLERILGNEKNID